MSLTNPSRIECEFCDQAPDVFSDQTDARRLCAKHRAEHDKTTIGEWEATPGDFVDTWDVTYKRPEGFRVYVIRNGSLKTALLIAAAPKMLEGMDKHACTFNEDGECWCLFCGAELNEAAEAEHDKGKCEDEFTGKDFDHKDTCPLGAALKTRA